MKILHISGAKGWGGNEQQIIYILPKLNALGVQNIVCGLKNSVLEKECEKNNISFTGLFAELDHFRAIFTERGEFKIGCLCAY